MEENKTRVFLTGATGVMGMAGLRELIKYPEMYSIIVLARDSKINRKKLKFFEKKGVKVLWGDLLDRKVLEQGISQSDIVLHVGGMVSPAADHYPEKTLKVNIGSIKLICDIVREIEDKDSEKTIKVVYVGSVSEYGSKLPPFHWGKAGDTLKAAKFDAYAVSKILGERALMEAGLKQWVSVRQTGILHPGLLKKANDPITFHFPIAGVLEWITAEDSGRLLEKICRPEVPLNFWCKIYNAGGGEKFRMTNFDFERAILKGLNCPPPEKIFETKWFATDNFHGMWFEDSDVLEEILHFRSGKTFDEAIDEMRKSLPFYFKAASIVPSALIKIFMKRIASDPSLGTLAWIKNNDEKRINAFWGSKEHYLRIPGWKDLNVKCLTKDSKNHPLFKSYDATITYKECEKGHKFKTSEVLEAAGHTCPFCLFENSEVKCPKN